jgi:lactoylglutathione lyase
MQYLHTMVRISSIEQSLNFYCTGLGMVEVTRKENQLGRFTLIFLTAPQDLESASRMGAPMLELTYNWDPEEYDSGRNFGHMAFRVDDIYKVCNHLKSSGFVINRPPRDGYMAFVRSPDGVSIELLQRDEPQFPEEPWASMPNEGKW